MTFLKCITTKDFADKSIPTPEQIDAYFERQKQLAFVRHYELKTEIWARSLAQFAKDHPVK